MNFLLSSLRNLATLAIMNMYLIDAVTVETKRISIDHIIMKGNTLKFEHQVLIQSLYLFYCEKI